MRENPSGKDLLEIAREILKNDLIPALPNDKRYSALMVANAMAIVMRQIDTDIGGTDNELAMLAGLLKTEGSVEQLNLVLAKRIREGLADSAETWAVLNHVAQNKAAESNPKNR